MLPYFLASHWVQPMRDGDRPQEGESPLTARSPSAKPPSAVAGHIPLPKDTLLLLATSPGLLAGLQFW